MIALRSGQRPAIPTKTSARLTEFKTYPRQHPRPASTRPIDKGGCLLAKARPGGRVHCQGKAYRPHASGVEGKYGYPAQRLRAGHFTTRLCSHEPRFVRERRLEPVTRDGRLHEPIVQIMRELASWGQFRLMSCPEGRFGRRPPTRDVQRNQARHAICRS